MSSLCRCGYEKNIQRGVARCCYFSMFLTKNLQNGNPAYKLFDIFITVQSSVQERKSQTVSCSYHRNQYRVKHWSENGSIFTYVKFIAVATVSRSEFSRPRIMTRLPVGASGSLTTFVLVVGNGTMATNSSAPWENLQVWIHRYIVYHFFAKWKHSCVFKC